MNTTIIALLMASNWITNCVMTQDNSMSGYAVDQISFSQKSDGLNVEFTRNWFSDAECSKSMDKKTATAGTVTFGSDLQTMNNEEVYAADWVIDGKKELGAIGITHDGSSLLSIKVARGFGTMRNTMLSLFSYKATPK